MKKNPTIFKKQIERFTPTISSGLSCVQVKSRVDDGLINVAEEKYSKSYLGIFTDNIFTFFNLLGLIVFIALLSVGAPLFDFVFVLVYLSNITIGITQEIRAKKCIDRLSLVAKKTVQVVRDGKVTEIMPSDIVLDEMIKLSAGAQIPTDCVIADGDVEVNESLLTGESVPVKKAKGDTLMSGSFIVSGNCFAVAEHVGKDNYVQSLSAQAKKYKKPHSEIMDSLKLMIKIIGCVIIPIGVAYIIKSYFLMNVSLQEAVLKTSTPVIGMIPSGMFLLTSLALAVGIIKLSAHNTLVQDLYSLETLARVDTICFDKTGTLTDGNMTVKEVISLKEDYPAEKISEIMSRALGILNDENSTATALAKYFGKSKKDAVSDKSVTCVHFNSSRKLSAVTFENSKTYAFGAPEFVLDKNAYSKLRAETEKYAQQGNRVLIFAESDSPVSGENIPTDFIPVAFFLLTDNIRVEAIETVRWFKENGVQVKVISGDNPLTVSEVSQRVGIENADKYISLEGLSDEDVYKAATEYTVFGRVSPEQKAILVKSLRAAGHVTAMTGDGVNDILALKEADCAVAVASGSEAARNIANLVLLDNNFNSMPQVVYEGRRVINNVQSSSSLYLMKTFFTMFIAFITLILPFMETYPWTLRQMNLLEIFVIGVPSFFLSFQPNKERVKGKFLRKLIAKALPSAAVMVLSVAVVEVINLFAGRFDEETYRTLGVFAFTFAGLVNLFVICKPFNTFRFILMTGCSIVVSAVFAVTVLSGIPALEFAKLSPVAETYPLLLLLFVIIIVDVPLALLLKKLSDKFTDIKVRKIKNT